MSKIGSDIINAVVELLRSYPQVRMDVTSTELTVKGSPGGFDLIVIDEEAEATIMAGCWHGHFSDSKDAAYFVTWMLSPRARVVNCFRRNKLSKSTVELQHLDGHWQVHGHVGFFTIPIGRLTTETVSNHVLSGDEAPFK